MEVNEEKRAKFMENAGKRVNKVMHDIQILEPMARSSVYDFTKEDVEEMFTAMQDALDSAKEEFNKKFEGRAKAERKQRKIICQTQSRPVTPLSLVRPARPSRTLLPVKRLVSGSARPARVASPFLTARATLSFVDSNF